MIDRLLFRQWSVYCACNMAIQYNLSLEFTQNIQAIKPALIIAVTS